MQANASKRMDPWTASLVAMRWEQLFADLAAQLDAAETAEQHAEDASRARAEHGRVRLVDRLRGALGHQLALRCRGGAEISGRLVEVGVDWLLLVDGQGREVLVATAAVTVVAGLGVSTAAGTPDGMVAQHL